MSHLAASGPRPAAASAGPAPRRVRVRVLASEEAATAAHLDEGTATCSGCGAVPLAAGANGNGNGSALFEAAAATAGPSSWGDLPVSSAAAAEAAGAAFADDGGDDSSESSVDFVVVPSWDASSRSAPPQPVGADTDGLTGSGSDSAAAAATRQGSGAARGAGAAPPVVMSSGASMLPHPEKAHRGGEDAFFIAEPPLAIGVADGVGGWAEIGVDAGAYARLFMVHAKDEAEAAMAASDGALSPQSVLERAYYRTNVQGSSTVCILSLNGSTLCASNLGDSGFVLVRDGAAAFQSPQQQHNFNFPYQLGSADGGASDHPQSAMRFELTVRPGDIVISGTDGLWDNVFAEEAAMIVSRCRAQGDGPEAAANTLYARMRAMDPKCHSPFSYAAIQAGYVFLGGKLDDITVVVSYVEPAASPAGE